MMLQPCRVLIADDDEEICSLMRTFLRRGPYELTVCNDAESALGRIARQEAFDIIICDFTLPGLSGIELIAQIRAQEVLADVRIVMISGHSSHAISARARSAGADAFLAKPFTLAQLRATVQALLAGRLSVAAGR